LSSKIVEGKLHALLDAILNDLRNIINVLATDCQQDQRALILFRGLQSLTVGPPRSRWLLSFAPQIESAMRNGTCTGTF
jgi:hypothetical protein